MIILLVGTEDREWGTLGRQQQQQQLILVIFIDWQDAAELDKRCFTLVELTSAVGHSLYCGLLYLDLELTDVLGFDVSRHRDTLVQIRCVSVAGGAQGFPDVRGADCFCLNREGE